MIATAVDVPRSTRFGCGSDDEDASGDGTRVGVEEGVQVVSVSFWIVFLFVSELLLGCGGLSSVPTWCLFVFFLNTFWVAFVPALAF